MVARVTSLSFYIQPPSLHVATPPCRWLWRARDCEKWQQRQPHCPAASLSPYLPPAAQPLPSSPTPRAQRGPPWGPPLVTQPGPPHQPVSPSAGPQLLNRQAGRRRSRQAGVSAFPVICFSEICPALLETPNQNQMGMTFLFKPRAICFPCLHEHSLGWLPGEYCARFDP